MKREHCKFSASHSSRWMQCPASWWREQESPTATAGAVVAAGTIAHAWAAHYLKPQDFAEPAHPLEGAYIEYVSRYVAWIKETFGEACLEEENDIYTRIELKMKYLLASSLPPAVLELEDEFFGTVDFLHYDARGDIIHIVDLKTGFVPVFPKQNTQLMLYALGALQIYSTSTVPAKIRLHIYQPSVATPRQWTTSLEELSLFAYRVRIALSAIAHPSGRDTYAPDATACTYCQHRTKCPELADMVYDALSAPTASPIDKNKIKYLLKNRKFFQNFLDDLEVSTCTAISVGRMHIDGVSVEERRARRRWKSDEKTLNFVRQKFGDEAFTSRPLPLSKYKKQLSEYELVDHTEGYGGGLYTMIDDE